MNYSMSLVIFEALIRESHLKITSITDKQPSLTIVNNFKKSNRTCNDGFGADTFYRTKERI